MNRTLAIANAGTGSSHAHSRGIQMSTATLVPFAIIIFAIVAPACTGQNLRRVDVSQTTRKLAHARWTDSAFPNPQKTAGQSGVETTRIPRRKVKAWRGRQSQGRRSQGTTGRGIDRRYPSNFAQVVGDFPFACREDPRHTRGLVQFLDLAKTFEFRATDFLRDFMQELEASIARGECLPLPRNKIVSVGRPMPTHVNAGVVTLWFIEERFVSWYGYSEHLAHVESDTMDLDELLTPGDLMNRPGRWFWDDKQARELRGSRPD